MTTLTEPWPEHPGPAYEHPGPAHGVRCPFCLKLLDWSDAPLVRTDRHGGLEYLAPTSPLRHPPAPGDLAAAAARTDLSLVCKDSHNTPNQHSVPIRYVDHPSEPLVIGIVGRVASGKSHLIAAMLHRLASGVVAADYRLSVTALDMRIDAEFTRRYTDRLFGSRRQLPATAAGPPTLVNAFEIAAPGGRTRVVAFFDVSGETLAEGDEGARFVAAVGALMFVVDAGRIPALNGGAAEAAGDPAFDVVITMIRQTRLHRDHRFVEIPAAIVVNKADLIRRPAFGLRIVNRYAPVGSADRDEYDLRQVGRESGDIYTLLAMNGGDRLLTPMSTFAPTSLHLVSATGISPDDAGMFPEDGFGPRRVLKPLLTLLAEAAVLGEGPREQVRAWSR